MRGSLEQGAATLRLLMELARSAAHNFQVRRRHERADRGVDAGGHGSFTVGPPRPVYVWTLPDLGSGYLSVCAGTRLIVTRYVASVSPLACSSTR